MNGYNLDLHYNNPNRSPQSQRGSSLNRQPSRQQFNGYAMPPALYTAEGHPSTRFDAPRFGNATVGGYGNGYDMGGQSWNGASFGQNGMGGQNLRKPNSRGRAAIPNAWMDQQHAPVQNVNDFMGMNGMQGHHMRGDQMSSDVDEELIPTAIVIKNIPFAVKKEQLVQIMTDMNLPLPYAFNYHFDNGVFRGLAFANFTNADETAAVIDSMNHFELNGRKLRVEYKKMLPAAERERIEREKRERRGQLEEQHRPSMPATLQSQASVGSLSSRVGMASSPSPVSARNMKLAPAQPPSFGAAPSSQQLLPADVDLNDPKALTFYTRLVIFKEDPSKDLLVFPPTLEPAERRIVHTLAHHMGLGHTSKTQADGRAVNVFKEPRRLSPPMPQIQALQGENRRALNRAATTDFSEYKANEPFYAPSGLRTQTSGYLGGFQDASAQLGAGNNLRAAKSFADLRSYTPSPVPSTASFPASLSTNVARLQEYARDPNQASTPTLLTPTSSLADRGESSGIINGLGNMSLGSGFNSSPRGLRGLPSWDRDNAGAIGGHRSFSTTFEQTRGPQPSASNGTLRGTMQERSVGFSSRPRQNGHMSRNSDEISQQSSAPEITVEH